MAFLKPQRCYPTQLSTLPNLCSFGDVSLYETSRHIRAELVHNKTWHGTKEGLIVKEETNGQGDRWTGGQVGRAGREKSYPSQQLSLTPVLPDCQHVITLSENPSSSIVGY